MSKHSLEGTAQALVADGKGILAADETVGTISKRFAQSRGARHEDDGPQR
jgi:fructose-bisphosphate aldolase class 1